MNKKIFFVLYAIYACVLRSYCMINDMEKEENRLDLIIEIIKQNSKLDTGWRNIITFGSFHDHWHLKLRNLPLTFITSNSEEEDYFFEETVHYGSNIIVLECYNFTNFDDNLRQILSHPNWHPHANIIIYYHKEEVKEKIAKIFFALWYYRAPNAVLIQYDDVKEIVYITDYNPYSSDYYNITYKYGCWTAKNIGIPIYKFDDSFVCEPECRNVTVTTKRRANHLGSCIGFETYTVNYNNSKAIKNLNLFEDKGKNLHGYTMSAFATEHIPFIKIDVYDEFNYLIQHRDGMVWNTLSEKMNFKIYLNNILALIKTSSNAEVNIQQIFSVAHRKGDLFLIPIYQFDVVVVEIDYTFAYRASGVCFVSHRADFETIFFDPKALGDNLAIIIQFMFVTFGIWLVFTLYSSLESTKVTLDLIGKNFMNTLRNILLINLWKPPKNQSFRLFLTITIWGFFVLNFSTQAAIISFFTAFKRGKEVETFDDIVEKGYKVEGIPSPDVVLPDTEEKFRIINSRLVSINNIFECLNKMSNDSRRFCLMDCSVGEYMVRNQLNEKGEQYLHIAKDRVHNYYLNIVLQKHSALTNNINKYMMMFVEAGLIQKWEQYRYTDLKEEALVKPLSFEDLRGIFNIYIGCVIITFVIFLLELVLGNFSRMLINFKLKCINCKKRYVVWKRLKNAKKQKKNMVSNSTQTLEP